MKLAKYLLNEEAFNKHNVRELVLYITNDADLYRQRITPIVKNLQKHLAKGRYSATEAQKSWKRLADEGAKKYDKEFSTAGAKTFSVADRKQAALDLADEYEEWVNDKG